MTPERYRQIVELCQAVWALVPEHRAEFLTKAVKCDESLRREVEAMLAADRQSAAFLSDTPDDLAASAFSSIQPQLPIGASFGGYKIIACLGFGGMGQVFLAQDLRLGRKVVYQVAAGRIQSRPPLASPLQRRGKCRFCLEPPQHSHRLRRFRAHRIDTLPRYPIC